MQVNKSVKTEAEKMNVLGIKTISNTASLVITEIDDRNDTVKAGMRCGDTTNIRTYKLHYCKRGCYFNYGKKRQYLFEFIRIF